MIKFRSFSKYDDTDVLKSSIDSSILNKEEKGKLGDTGKVALSTALGGVLGASGKKTTGAKIGGGVKGALIGAAVGIGANALNSMNKKRKEDEFYNQRLREAKRAAKKREALDWENKIHYRGGYE